MKETLKLETNLVPALPVAETATSTDFTGIARSIETFLNNGTFKNYRIVTLHLKKGKVTKIEYSDPYANFEALVKMELANELGLMHLNTNWAVGKTLER